VFRLSRFYLSVSLFVGRTSRSVDLSGHTWTSSHESREAEEAAGAGADRRQGYSSSQEEGCTRHRRRRRQEAPELLEEAGSKHNSWHRGGQYDQG